MAKITEELSHYMRNALTIGQLRDMLNEMVDDGLGECVAGFRIGHTFDGKILTFPLADVRVNQEESCVLFTPAPSIKEVNGHWMPEFDVTVDIKEDAFVLQFEEIHFQA
jgi:hypothetical protein